MEARPTTLQPTTDVRGRTDGAGRDLDGKHLANGDAVGQVVVCQVEVQKANVDPVQPMRAERVQLDNGKRSCCAIL